MGRVRFRGRDWVKSIFLDSNVDPGSTNYVDPGTCLTWQNHGNPQTPATARRAVTDQSTVSSIFHACSQQYVEFLRPT